MQRSLTTVIALMTLFAAPAAAEDARSILEKVRAKQLERWTGVDRYAIDKSVMGNRATLLFERYALQGPDGKPQEVFRASPVSAATAESNAGVDTKTLLTEYAKGMEMTGAAIESEMEQSGLPTGLLKGLGAGADPWATPDPAAMMTGMAPIVRDMADAEERLEATATADAKEDAAGMAAFAERAKLVGSELVEGRRAFHLRAENMNQVQQIEGETYVLDDASVWIDARDYVPLRSRVDGVATSRGESRPIVLESVNLDYRRVSGSLMYEPYRQVLKMAGLMNPEQEAQMGEARQQLAEMDAQLAELPESQRQMVMQQMGPQLEMMRKMAAGNGMELETLVHQIVVNPDAAALRAMQSQVSMAGMPLVPPGAAEMAGGTMPMAPPPVGASAPMGTLDSSDPHQRAQQACLAQKVKEAEEAQKKKRGLGRLMSAVGRVGSRYGIGEVSQGAEEIHSASATAEDLTAAARDLGLTEEDLAECQNLGA